MDEDCSSFWPPAGRDGRPPRPLSPIIFTHLPGAASMFAGCVFIHSPAHFRGRPTRLRGAVSKFAERVLSRSSAGPLDGFRVG